MQHLPSVSIRFGFANRDRAEAFAGSLKAYRLPTSIKKAATAWTVEVTDGCQRMTTWQRVFEQVGKFRGVIYTPQVEACGPIEWKPLSE